MHFHILIKYKDFWFIFLIVKIFIDFEKIMLNRMSIGAKIVCIFMCALLPVAWMSYLFTIEKLAVAEFAQKEQQGNRLLGTVIQNVEKIAMMHDLNVNDGPQKSKQNLLSDIKSSAHLLSQDEKSMSLQNIQDTFSKALKGLDDVVQGRQNAVQASFSHFSAISYIILSAL